MAAVDAEGEEEELVVGEVEVEAVEAGDSVVVTETASSQSAE